MRYWVTLSLALLLAPRLAALEASIDHAVFRHGASLYLEVYLGIEAASLAHPPAAEDGRVRAAVDVLLLVQRDGQAVIADRFRLHGPATATPVDFLDLKRYALPAGTYELLVELTDGHDPGNHTRLRRPVAAPAPAPAGVGQSDIVLLAASRAASAPSPFNRGDRYLEPLPTHRYGPRAAQLLFYQEVYGADSNSVAAGEVLIRYVLQRPRPEGPLLLLTGHQRHAPAPVIAVVGALDIARLPAGTYELLVEVRRRNGDLLSARATTLTRRHPLLGRDWPDLTGDDVAGTFVAALDSAGLTYSLQALTPRLPGQDLPLVERWLRRDSLDRQRAYLLAYWVRHNPTNPEYAYREYMTLARALDQQFQSGFRHGFETDRGYVYLRYGAPDDIYTQEEEPSAPPYEIWVYFDFPATRQNEVKFLFYNPSLVPGDFQLLHSTALGERNNPRWELDLYRNAPGEVEGDAFDGTRVRDNVNRNARRFFRDN